MHGILVLRGRFLGQLVTCMPYFKNVNGNIPIIKQEKSFIDQIGY